MSVRSRRVWLVCLVVGVLCLPGEILFGYRLLSDGYMPVARRWVAGLSVSERRVALASVGSYPKEFAQVLMASASGADRAKAAQAMISEYLANHPDLSREKVSALQTLSRAATPESMEVGNPHRAAVISAVANAKIVLGSRFKEIFSFGRSNAGGTAGLPVMVRLQYAVEQSFVVAAAPDCNCFHTSNADCGSGDWICSELQGCEGTWTGCDDGPFLGSCDGYCIHPPS